MASKLITIAEAVKDYLNSQSLTGTFTPYTFTAVRTYLPWKTIKELATLTVMVIPGGLSSEAETRAGYQDEFVVDVGIGKKVDITDNTDADAMMGLAETIEASLRDMPITDYTWIKNEIKAIYDEQILLQNHVFLTVIRMTFNATS